MFLLRLARRLPAWALAIVLVAWGINMVAPLFKPLTLSTLCRGGGAIVTVVAPDQEGLTSSEGHQHGQCGQCMPADGTPPDLTQIKPTPQRLADASVHAVPAPPLPKHRPVPPPARGPPSV
ncbi:hypothetical protein [Aquabacterium sp.]|uniref:hypothetical protein n=1 Tax=Aquabacterium sp. TaxID=1872578 RepID=UPI004037AFFE